MDNNLIRNITDGYNAYVKPYVSMGNSRVSFGKFNPQSFKKAERKKSGKGTADKKYGRNGAHSEKAEQDDSGIGADERNTAADAMTDSGKSSLKRTGSISRQSQGMPGGGSRQGYDMPGSGLKWGQGISNGGLRQGQGMPGGSSMYAGGEPDSGMTDLQQAIVWAEILGEPVSKKRRRKRVDQQNGNQGYAYRR